MGLLCLKRILIYSMTNNTLKSKKEFETNKCPTCKTTIKNIKELDFNLMYKCGNCNNNFFITLCPKVYFSYLP